MLNFALRQVLLGINSSGERTSNENTQSLCEQKGIYADMFMYLVCMLYVVCVCMFVNMHVFKYLCMYVHACIYVFIYV